MDRKHIKFSVDAQEYQKLQEENKKLKEIIIGLGPQGSYLISAEAEVKKLQEENESLKKDIKDIQEIWVKSRDYGNQMFVENEKLKKDIEFLKL